MVGALLVKNCQSKLLKNVWHILLIFLLDLIIFHSS